MGLGNVALVLIAACSVGRTYLASSALPERVASHFDGAGRPNGWMARDAFVTTNVTMFALLVVVFVGMPAFLRRVPVRFVNLPNKDYWLAPERREASVERIGEWLSWLGVATALVLALAEELALRANLHGGGQMTSMPLVVGLGAYAAFMGGWLVAFYAAFRLPKPVRR
ncbi:MAG TPA: DUF1648 domain-containing protein [Candidatus Eisenbacteria bacterium]|nr:DUF1648 domain-containing protein [Candidatus Eisenbacteria bacterium]